MSAIPSVKLNTGALIPAIGLGAAPTVFSPETIENAKNWFLTALQAGYRHFDTAQIYGTEKGVGEAIRESGIPRSQIFITTKLPWHHNKYIERSFNESLNNLGVDYVDLYLLHFPQSLSYPTGYDAPTSKEDLLGLVEVVDSPSLNDNYAQLEKLYASGRAKAIGVSNFSIKTLEQLFETAKVVPAVNQIELHPFLAQTELVKYCQDKGIVVEAYSPTGRGSEIREDPLIVELAAKYKVSATQIILAWHIARGTVAVPKSENPTRQKENITLPALSAEDVKKITGLDRNERLVNKAGPDGKLYGWTMEQYGW